DVYKRQIPTVQVEKVKADQAPKNQYVYRSF
ncbi:TIGR03943 family protein, partial [Enterococcus sp. S157_ASV_20]|nr:TIGR03943 family protein [Enterococcus sp. S157_ASV_20]